MAIEGATGTQALLRRPTEQAKMADRFGRTGCVLAMVEPERCDCREG